MIIKREFSKVITQDPDGTFWLDTVVDTSDTEHVTMVMTYHPHVPLPNAFTLEWAEEKADEWIERTFGPDEELDAQVEEWMKTIRGVIGEWKEPEG
jgi:hypothetical protein